MPLPDVNVLIYAHFDRLRLQPVYRASMATPASPGDGWSMIQQPHWRSTALFVAEWIVSRGHRPAACCGIASPGLATLTATNYSELMSEGR